MTEADWLACRDPVRAAGALQDRVPDRKYRLFGLACCERIRYWITDERSRAAVAFVRRFADVGLRRRKGRPAAVNVARAAVEWANESVYAAFHQERPDPAVVALQRAAFDGARAAFWLLGPVGWRSAEHVAGYASHAAAWHSLWRARPGRVPEWDAAATGPERGQQWLLMLDVLGNPFRPVKLAPHWRTAGAQAVAERIYEEGDFAAMPVLADALEDAGCDVGEVLGHCRGPGPHARGCWVIDLVLGKA